MIRISAAPVSRVSSLSRSRICACTVTSSAVVGSSAMISRGLAGQRHRDHRALAHAARELVRIGQAATLCVRDPHLVQQVRGRPQRGAPARRAVHVQRLADLHADREDRVERRHRLLEDHRDPIAAHRPHGFGVETKQVLPFEQHLARHDAPRRVRYQAQQRQRRHALAGARLADDRERLPRLQVERHVVDRRDRAALGSKARRQAPNAQQRLGHVRSPSSSSGPGRSRCASRSATVAPRRRAVRPRSS